MKAWFSAHPGLACAAIAGVLVTSLLPAFFAVATGALVASLEDIAQGRDTSEVFRWAIAVGAIFAIQQAIAPWRSTVIAGDLGRRVTTALADRQTAALLLPATIAHLEDPSFLDDVTRATGTGGIGPWAATTGLLQLWTSRIAGAGSLAVAGRYQPVAAAILLIALIVNVTILRSKYMQLVEVMNQRARGLRRSNYLRDLAHDPRMAKEVRLFGFDGWLISSFDQEWLTAMREVWRQRAGTAVAAFGATVPLVAAVAFALWSVRSSISDGGMDAGATAAFAQGLLGSLSLASVARSDSWIAYGTATLPAQEHLERRVSTESALVLPGTLHPGNRPHEIRFKDVAFTYRGAERPVFTSLDLAIPSGTSLGIVGVNGAGKTTLVKLLTRLYDPGAGAILIDGIDAREFEPHEWQRRFAVLFQDFLRYPLTLGDNITLTDQPDHPTLHRIAERAGVSGLEAELPQGWDTVLSRQLGGVDLSGGQWQRVALARAFASAEAGADVLVLDEPTSQMDTRAEAQFYREFLTNTAGLTTIVISHRLAAVRQADSIAVLSNGLVAEQGTHDQLMEQRGLYRTLFDLQASRFTEGSHA